MRNEEGEEYFKILFFAKNWRKETTGNISPTYGSL